MSEYHEGLNKKQIKLMEKLAAIEHDRWADWQAYIMDNSFDLIDKKEDKYLISIPVEWWENWRRQIDSFYSELSDDEKDRDRREVMRYFGLINNIK